MDEGEREARLIDELRRSEAFARKLLESSLNGTYIYDIEEKRNVYINPRYTELTGYTIEDLNSMTTEQFAELFHDEDRQAVFAHMAEVTEAADGELIEIEYRFKTADGRWIWCLSWDSVFERNEEGNTRQFMGTFLDVTEMKQAQMTLRSTEEQLRQAQKMEAIGRLAGGVAHDFNNLLTVITGCVVLALERVEDEELRSLLDDIAGAGERATLLTRQLLAFSRRQVLQPKVLDINELVGRVGTMLRRLIGEDIRFETKLEPKVDRVKFDPGQIEQIILNLAVNARDAMPQGGILTIETANIELSEEYARSHVGASPGPHVMLAVSDTGIGMDPDTREHIFEPFFTTKGTGKGSGLGLSMVYGIVKQSGGNIWVYSEPGKGTTFKVYIPRTGEAPTRPQTVERLHSMMESQIILLVEDDPGVRKLLTRILTAEGYVVLSAGDPGKALRLSREQPDPIALLLTDVVMPGMGGRELANRLKAERADLRILYMSGYTDNAIVHHGVLDPGVDFLEKPITARALLQKVRAVLDKP